MPSLNPVYMAEYPETVVMKNLPVFQDYQINENRLNEFFMRYVNCSFQFVTLIVTITWAVSC